MQQDHQAQQVPLASLVMWEPQVPLALASQEPPVQQDHQAQQVPLVPQEQPQPAVSHIRLCRLVILQPPVEMLILSTLHHRL